MWWKCDLQVATPAWKRFKIPEGVEVDTAEGRDAFARQYIDQLRRRGISVIALADHHTAAWLDILRGAADDDITIFPGVEITTNTGADGVHLTFIGDVDRSTAEVEQLLTTVCGFSEDHPPFDVRTGDPASAPRSLGDILDLLPDRWLVVAPHVFNDNGIGSKRTVVGDVRWKALHHDRMNALDVGQPSDDEESFNQRFRDRSLSDFPCLEHIAFVSTSDAYEIADLGSRYCWIRMAEPSLEGLRQAFLDHEARIIRDSDSRLATFRDEDPNRVNHAWVSGLTIDGAATSAAPIEVEFDPRLNVIIGGRGSGKSTLVAALRELYSSSSDLPAGLKQDAEAFAQAVFPRAKIEASHELPISQDSQRAQWSRERGSTTWRNDRETPTEFPVRVVSQKELYERVAGDSLDPSVASRNLLSIVDNSLEHADPADRIAGFDEAIAGSRSAWTAAVQALKRARTEIDREDATRARIDELEHQIQAFDAESASARRANNDVRVAEMNSAEALLTAAERRLLAVEDALKLDLPDEPEDPSAELRSALDQVREVLSAFEEAVVGAVEDARQELDASRQDLSTGPLHAAVEAARADLQLLKAELEALGMDGESYDSVRQQLRQEQQLLQALLKRKLEIPDLEARVSETWDELLRVAGRRRARRQSLVDEVALRSGSLRFEVSDFADAGGWVSRIRELLSLRSDAFLDDIPRLAAWMCDRSVGADERTARLLRWRDALVSNHYRTLGRSGIRSTWWQKLEGLDESLRLRIAAEYPEDLVTMEFLREGGSVDRAEDWQSVSQGSPGQRSAAMLSFVLHHGTEPLVLDQPEDDLDSAWISDLIIREIRRSRWSRQVIVITHNANIPVNGDAERVIVMENREGQIGVKGAHVGDPHVGPIEDEAVRHDIQHIMEGGVRAFMQRERRYNNELSTYRAALHGDRGASR